MIKIDKGIPFPAYRAGKGYPWRIMLIGDSFEYDGSYDPARQSAAYYTRKLGKIFRARTLNNKVRVWRIK